jgi:hypothetical protein
MRWQKGSDNMAVMCRKCMKGKEMSIPPVRTRTAPCDICGDQSEDPRGRNYDYPDNLIPGSKMDPNTIAEREAAGAQ